MQQYPVGTDFIMYKVHHHIFEAETYGPWNREHYQAVYERHNADIRRYFSHRPDDFLELNVGDDDAFARLCRFLGRPVIEERLPHVNRSA